MSFAQTTILGRIGKEPVYRQYPNGLITLSALVIVNKFWNDKTTGQRREKTFSHFVLLKDQRAVTAYNSGLLKTGNNILFVCEPQSRPYTDPKTGEERWITDNVVDTWHFAGYPASHYENMYNNPTQYNNNVHPNQWVGQANTGFNPQVNTGFNPQPHVAVQNQPNQNWVNPQAQFANNQGTPNIGFPATATPAVPTASPVSVPVPASVPVDSEIPF